MTNKPNTSELLEALKAGKTVYICTATRITKLTKKVLDRFNKAGAVLLKQGKSGSAYMASGKKFVCIDYCNIVIEGSE